MRQRKIGRKRARLRRAKAEHEMQEESALDAKLGYAAFTDIFDVTGEEAAQFDAVLAREPAPGLSRTLSDMLFKVDRHYAHTLDQVEQAVTAYEDWLNTVFDSPLTERVLERSISEGEQETALKAAGAKEEHQEGFSYLQGSSTLQCMTSDFCSSMETIDERALYTHLLLAAEHFRTAHAALKPNTLKRYVQDFREAFTQGIMKSELFTAKLILEHNARAVSSVVLRNPSETIETLTEMNEKLPAYQEITTKNELRLIERIYDADAGNAAVEDFAARVGCVRSELKELAHLLRGVPQSDRGEVFEYITEHPSRLTLYSALRRVFTACECASLFLEERTTQFGALIEVVERVAIEPKQRKAAHVLALHGETLLASPDADALLRIAQTYASADIILQDYLAAYEVGEHNKSALTCTIGQAAPQQAQLKQLRAKLHAAAEEDLAWVQNTDITTHIQKLLRHDERKTAIPRAAPKNRSSTYDDTLLHLEAAGICASTRDAFVAAYECAAPTVRSKLLRIARRDPDATAQLADDAQQLGNHQAYQSVLTDPVLFRRYRASLAAGDTRLRDGLEDRSSYRDLLRLLTPVAPTVSHEAPEETKDAVVLSCDRVIVYGGSFKKPERLLLERSASTPVKYYGFFNRRKNISAAVREGDAVVCITTACNHPTYYALKHICKQRGVQLHSFNDSRPRALAAFLKRAVVPN
ncbi:MAG: hypothetical protein OXR66_05195 [Candidatus Woesearchaeota archaeon]|nr:hypothetical protein [Candidatus Woesearchaeota archaeon]